jgi:hypothetical protein
MLHMQNLGKVNIENKAAMPIQLRQIHTSPSLFSLSANHEDLPGELVTPLPTKPPHTAALDSPSRRLFVLMGCDGSEVRDERSWVSA